MEFITAAAEHIDRMCEITDQAKVQLGRLDLTSGRRDIRAGRYGFRISGKDALILRRRMARFWVRLHSRSRRIRPTE